MEVSDQLHAPAALTLGKISNTHCIGGWVGSRGSLDNEEPSLLSHDVTSRRMETQTCLSATTGSNNLYRI
jgi:hypothetical protein